MTPSHEREPQFDPPYDELLSGILSFKTLADTEKTLLKLENLRQRFLGSSDKKGMEYCRRVGALGRRRAELISRNRRVDPRKRLQKREAAVWFRVWLETPELFEDWVSLRKRTEDYLKLQELERSS
jgi:hypothetical protein